MAIYRFASFEFNSLCLTLSKNKVIIQLRPKSAQLLNYLIKNSHSIITKETLLSEIWSESVVSEGVIYETIKELRKALGDTIKHSQFIVTIPKKGYQWIYPLQVNALSTQKKQSQKRIFIIASVLLLSSFGGVFLINKSSKSSDLTSIQHQIKQRPLVVVLPFNNQSKQKNTSWISMGLMDMLQNNLAYQDSFDTYSSSDISYLYKQNKISLDDKLIQAQIDLLAQYTKADFIIQTIITGKAEQYNAKTNVYSVKGKVWSEFLIKSSTLGDIISQLSYQLTERFIRTKMVFENYESIKHDPFTVRAFAEGNQALLSRKYRVAKNYFDVVFERNPQFFLGKYKLAKAEIELGELNTAKRHLKELVQATNSNYHQMVFAHSSALLGKVYYYQNDYQKSEHLYKQAYQIFLNRNEMKWVAWMHILLSRIENKYGNQKQTYFHLNKALQIYQKIGHLLGQGWTLEFLSDYAVRQKEIEKAKALLNRSIAVRKRAGNQLGVAAALIKTGNLFLEYDHQKSLQLYMEASNIYHLVDDKLAQNNVFSVLVRYWIKHQDLNKADFFALQLKKNAQVIQSEKSRLDAKDAQMQLLIAKGLIQEAKTLLAEMLPISRRLGYDTLTDSYQSYLYQINHKNNLAIKSNNQN